jgi:hypothetical protein
MLTSISIHYLHQYEDDNQEEEVDEMETESEPLHIDWSEGIDLPSWVAQPDSVER